ncbi:MAG TPA: ABC transporter permease [Alphaproteobacteria bacterium]|nr:ABC transporter permease [Alphaproteobacteria bacterium]
MTPQTLRVPRWRLEHHGGEAVLELSGDWIARETGVRDAAMVRQLLADAAGAAHLRIATDSLGRWDSALIAFIEQLREERAVAARSGRAPELDDAAVPPAARRLLVLAAGVDTAGPAVGQGVRPPSLLSRVGVPTIAAWRGAVAAAALVGDVTLRAGAALSGRLCSRVGDVLLLMRDAGAYALPIVTITNALVGGILAFVGAVQLRRFGTQIFVADLVGIATAREMAAVVTAVIMAGRTGGAYAAQIATMQGNEEIDALRVLGIPVRDYLVMPRVMALMAMMPLLYVYACAIGIVGGGIVTVATVDVTTAAYIQETQRAITYKNLLIGLSKSVVFGAVVALAGCYMGLRAGRSSADVGYAATGAVVTGIIVVIALDWVFAVCANALGL